MEKTKLSEKKTRSASALILAVVLTSLLAIIGTVFLMVARVDKIATSAITENKELQFALESVVAEISQQLALDIPNEPAQEYYDYPDPCNAFLASLEPNESGGDYFWRQISDVTGVLGTINQRNVPAIIIGEHDRIDPGNPLADADGDGVADSRWIKLPNITTSKNKPVFAAVRVIDNGGMLNVNTAYKFDPTETIGRIDGSSQMQINLMALSWRPGYCSYDFADEIGLSNTRGHNVTGLDPLYEQNVIWQFGGQFGLYTPFGIDDELEMRNRFLLNHEGIDTRLEGWGGEFRKAVLSAPVTSGGKELDTWFKRVYDTGGFDPNYAYRHIATAYNMDRIINPVGPTLNFGKMLNVNKIATLDDLDRLYRTLIRAISPSVPDVDAIAAQLAVNIKDFNDSDADVTVYPNPDDGKTYYGFETQPFISEIGIKIDAVAPDNPANNHFAVELYNPFNIPIPLGDFKLSLYDGTNLITDIPLIGFIDPNKFFVVLDNAAEFPLPGGVNSHEDAALQLSGNYVDADTDGDFESWQNYDIALKRDVLGTDIYLDNQSTDPYNQPTDPCWFAQGTVKYVQRDDTYWHIVYEEDVNDSDLNLDTLGFTNNYRTTATNYNLSLANHNFITIGDIALPLKIGPNTTPNGTIGRKLPLIASEADIRIDLTLPAYQQIFNYLTVMDPNELQYGGHPATETRVKGRININTAPWFVIAQLPWVSQQLAQAIVAYRDKTVVPGQTDPNYIDKYVSGSPDGRSLGTGIPAGLREIPGFASIGELTTVINIYAALDEYNIHKYALDGVDQFGFPDLTFDPTTFLDGAPDDFEERDLIFSRISNLVTVRSDVFTAYILVRIGADGPQKRAIAILDRSEVSDISGRVKLIALHPVPDPR